MNPGDRCKFTVSRFVFESATDSPSIKEEEIVLSGIIVGVYGNKADVMSGDTVYRVEACKVKT